MLAVSPSLVLQGSSYSRQSVSAVCLDAMRIPAAPLWDRGLLLAACLLVALIDGGVGKCDVTKLPVLVEAIMAP